MPASEERTRANGQAATSSPERFSKFKMQAQNAVQSRSALLEKARRQAKAAAHSRTPEKGERPSGLRAKEEELRAQVRAQQNKSGEGKGSPVELAGQMKDVLEGDCFFFGHGRPQSYEEGFKHYMQVAKTNYGPAMGRLGACFHHGRGVESNEALALEWYEKGADLGDADSMNALGFIHESGKLKSRGVDLEQAFKFYKQAAEAGHADGMTNLGYLYEKGHGVLQNLELASSWYERAAQKGYAKAQNNLGSLHYSGKGVRQSYWKAEEYYRLASAQGNASGMNNLAICLEEGLGTKKNVPEAIRLYEKAALLGNNNAAYNLGSLLLSRDEHTTAVRWFRKAADEGNGDAVYNLGKLYEEGVGEELQRDLNYAGELYQRARELGNGDAEEALERVAAARVRSGANAEALLAAQKQAEADAASAERRCSWMAQKIKDLETENKRLKAELSEQTGDTGGDGGAAPRARLSKASLSKIPSGPAGAGPSATSSELGSVSESGAGGGPVAREPWKAPSTFAKTSKQQGYKQWEKTYTQMRADYIRQLNEVRSELQGSTELNAVLGELLQKMSLRIQVNEKQIRTLGREPEVTEDMQLRQIMGLSLDDLDMGFLADPQGEGQRLFARR